MQLKVVLSVLSLALAASAAPAPNGSTTPAQTCNSTPGKAVYCCDSFSSGLGLGLDCLLSGKSYGSPYVQAFGVLCVQTGLILTSLERRQLQFQPTDRLLQQS